MRLLTRALRFCRSAILQLDRATLCRRGKVYVTGFRMAIAKRFDTLVRVRIIAEKLSTPVHLEQPTRAPIAIQSVVQQSILETLSHTHANLARGKHSTARLTIRRAHATFKSAIGSTRWSRAVSVLTTAITRLRRVTLQSVRNEPPQLGVHRFVMRLYAHFQLLENSSAAKSATAA